jgi:hypothetical protein
MRHLVATLALLAALAGAAGLAAFRAGDDPAVRRALERQDALAWLRADFGLTDAQFAEIKRLHDAYASVCDEHCRQIREAMDAREDLKRSGRATAEQLAAADRRVEELVLICESAIATHVRACAAHMAPEAAERYLALVLPKIKEFDHLGAPDLRLDRSAP